MGKMGVTLHNHMFGFETTGQMRHFHNIAFRWTRGEEKRYGLGPFEQMALALWKMRSGRPWIEIEGDMGALLGKGHLTTSITNWIHRLGSFSKQSLVGVPEAAYMDECIPEIYREYAPTFRICYLAVSLLLLIALNQSNRVSLQMRDGGLICHRRWDSLPHRDASTRHIQAAQESDVERQDGPLWCAWRVPLLPARNEYHGGGPFYRTHERGECT